MSTSNWKVREYQIGQTYTTVTNEIEHTEGNLTVLFLDGGVVEIRSKVGAIMIHPRTGNSVRIEEDKRDE